MMLQTINLSRIALALVISYLLVLAFSYGKPNGFLVDDAGKPRLTEYIGVRAAGVLVQQGKPAAAYDWNAHKSTHNTISANTGDGYYPWAYPPPYLFVAGLLAAMPYLLSAVIWLLSTLALQIWSVTKIAGTQRAALWALAAPPTLINAGVIHTGFLVAGLFGLGLQLLPAAPVAAGAALGLLIFKPQLGILIPVALAAGGYWRPIAAAALTVVGLCLAAMLAFGIEPWLAYPAQMERFTDVFKEGRLNMAMLVSVYGLGRTLGLGHTAALAPQVIVCIAAAVTVFKLWRGPDDFALKAAGLISASLLATPYLFPYDLTLLVVVLAFLYRAVGTFDGSEIIAIALAGVFLFLAPDAPFPSGLIANVLVAGLVARRWQMARKKHTRLQACASPTPLPVSAA